MTIDSTRHKKGTLPRGVQLARETYQEVLDAIKHQDDKINRFLVAIAFLTTGAIAYVLKAELLDVRFVAGPHKIPLIAIAAGIYLAATIIAVVLLLMALSTELKLPGAKPKDTEDAKLHESLLYFHMIGSQPLRSWFTRWDLQVDELEATLRKQYLREAHNLSERARVKDGLTDEAAAAYIYALMWLAVGLLLGTYTSQLPESFPGRGATKPLELPLAFWPIVIVGVVFASHALLHLHNISRHERSSPDVEWHRTVGRVYSGATTAPGALCIAGVVTPPEFCALGSACTSSTGGLLCAAASVVRPGEKVREAGYCALKEAVEEGQRLNSSLRTITRLMPCLVAYVLCASATAVAEDRYDYGWLAGVAVVTGVVWRISWGRISLARSRRLVVTSALCASAFAIGLPAWSVAFEQSWLAVAAAAGPATLLSGLTAVRQFSDGGRVKREAEAKLADEKQRSILLIPWAEDFWQAPSQRVPPDVDPPNAT